MKFNVKNTARNRFCSSLGICCFVLFLFPKQVRAQYNHLPAIPEIVYRITDYGATGDSKTINTIAIQKALDLAKGTGGKVVVPPGTYLTGPLELYSRTELEISKGATLRLLNNIESYPVVNGRYPNLINVSKQNDIKISGGGTLDGQGEIWWKGVEDKSLKFRRPQMVYIEGASNIEIGEITFLNPPNTHLSLKNCKEVYIHDITIQAPANSHNTDGINISAKNCTIERCNINTGDDNIAVNFGNKNPKAEEPEVMNLLIRNCTFGYGHGLSIGSFTSGGLKNMLVSNCKFDGTTSAIRIKTARGRGGVLQDVRYEDITITNSKNPIFISEYYPKEPQRPSDDTNNSAGEYNPVYQNISLKNIKVTNAQESLIIWGIPESPVQYIRFENVTISAKKAPQFFNISKADFVNCSIGDGDPYVFNAQVNGLK